jgi:TetR/AcrR family transcriptional regulator, regulator of biofilm formation and stress response
VARYAKGELRRQEILAATVELISEEGIAAVTHRAVAERAGVAASAPSHFFPSIDELVVEAFRSVMAGMMGDLEALSVRIVDTDMAREDAVDAYIKLVRRSAAKYDKVQFEGYLFAGARPPLRAAVDEAIAATHRTDSTLVTASRRDDLAWAAPTFTALANGFGLSRLASPARAARGVAGVDGGVASRARARRGESDAGGGEQAGDRGNELAGLLPEVRLLLVEARELVGRVGDLPPRSSDVVHRRHQVSCGVRAEGGQRAGHRLDEAADRFEPDELELADVDDVDVLFQVAGVPQQIAEQGIPGERAHERVHQPSGIDLTPGGEVEADGLGEGGPALAREAEQDFPVGAEVAPHR